MYQSTFEIKLVSLLLLTVNGFLSVLANAVSKPVPIIGFV